RIYHAKWEISQVFLKYAQIPDIHLSKNQKSSFGIVVDASLLDTLITDTAVKGHDRSYNAIDLFRAFCLRRFDITCRIGVHHHISRHPAHNRVAAMDDAALHQEFIKFLCWRRHILKSLTKRYHGKPHAFQILRSEEHTSE